MMMMALQSTMLVQNGLEMLFMMLLMVMLMMMTMMMMTSQLTPLPPHSSIDLSMIFLMMMSPIIAIFVIFYHVCDDLLENL